MTLAQIRCRDRLYFIRSDQYSFVLQGVPRLLDHQWSAPDQSQDQCDRSEQGLDHFSLPHSARQYEPALHVGIDNKNHR